MPHSILLAIHNVYTDTTSGAARCVRTMMKWLAQAGFQCHVLATTRFDGVPPASIEQHLDEFDVAVEPATDLSSQDGPRPVIRFQLDGVNVVMLMTRHNRLDRPDHAESSQFLKLFQQLVRRIEPNLLFAYGSHPVVGESMRLAHRDSIPTLFTVRRDGYENRDWFRHADHVLTPSTFLTDHYRRAIGLTSTALETPIDWSDVLASNPTREFVTFVNPSLQKGAAFFARLADVVGSRRPDIPMLVVESAMDGRVLSKFSEIDFGKYPQIMGGPPTTQPADFLGLTRLLLVPSVYEDAFPRVIPEALINGIPPLVSDRGGSPAAARGAGRVLPLPAWMTPTSMQLPTVEEVEPWFNAICELWNNPSHYAAASDFARQMADQYYSEPIMRRTYIEYFESLLR